MKDDPAFPESNLSGALGLTKREYFAATAVQGILANPETTGIQDRDALDRFDALRMVTSNAVSYADALIAELEKTK